MNEIFSFVKSNAYNSRSVMDLSRVNVHSTQQGTESTGNLEGKIWNLVAVLIKDLNTLKTFKNQINKWIPKDCLWRLCKVYVVQVGFLWKLLRSLLYLMESNIACSINSAFVLFHFILCISLFVLFMYFLFLIIYLFFYLFLIL